MMSLLPSPLKSPAMSRTVGSGLTAALADRATAGASSTPDASRATKVARMFTREFLQRDWCPRHEARRGPVPHRRQLTGGRGPEDVALLVAVEVSDHRRIH